MPKSAFFTEVKDDWASLKLVKKKPIEVEEESAKFIIEEPIETYTKAPAESEKVKLLKILEGKSKVEIESANKNVDKSRLLTIVSSDIEKEISQTDFKIQVVNSEINPEQTDDLRILFKPNCHFAQPENYMYPVVKMPTQNCALKLPRLGRSNQKGYKENEFFNEIKLQNFDIELANNVHMVIPNYNKPYEPDIVLFDKKLNLYIDVEIDEPYDGFYRFPTHNYKAENDFKQDNIRDLFFTESGWVVIRFTEKQVHKQPNECINYIKNVIKSLRGEEFNFQAECEFENQWDENQSIQWQLNKYREKYLEIHSFHKRRTFMEVVVNEQEQELIEENIQRTQFKEIGEQFDKDLHKYFHLGDKTGNAEYISVTTLVERFFQFDIIRYIQREAERTNRDEEELFREFQANRDEAATLGTELHKQIEQYYKNEPYEDSLKEFKHFLEFEKEKIKPKDLIFAEAEKKIYFDEFNVAGTVDCLFKYSDGKYAMVDWKRSKKLIIYGTNRPDKRGFQIDIEGLTSLTNCSYYRYCIQQNIYKYILEKQYDIIVSDMILAVLHEKYSSYHTLRLPEMIKETEIILRSLKHKI